MTEAFTKRITEHETKIIDLEERVEMSQRKLAALDRLERCIHDREQYSRRKSLRIHGMELSPVGSKENCFYKKMFRKA